MLVALCVAIEFLLTGAAINDLSGGTRRLTPLEEASTWGGNCAHQWTNPCNPKTSLCTDKKCRLAVGGWECTDNLGSELLAAIKNRPFWFQCSTGYVSGLSECGFPYTVYCLVWYKCDKFNCQATSNPNVKLCSEPAKTVLLLADDPQQESIASGDLCGGVYARSERSGFDTLVASRNGIGFSAFSSARD